MGSAFNNFERLAMTEEEFLRLSEADFVPGMARQPSFMQRMMGSPRPGSSSFTKRPGRTEFASPSSSRSNSPSLGGASPALSSVSMNSPRPSTDASSPRSLWGGFGMRKRTNTTSSFASMGGVIAEANTQSSIDTTIDPKLVDDEVRKSSESKRDTFGLPRAPWSPQLS